MKIGLKIGITKIIFTSNLILNIHEMLSILSHNIKGKLILILGINVWTKKKLNCRCIKILNHISTN